MSKDYMLSILIPSRNEMFVSNTVEDILKNKRGNTEIIVGLDGQWAEPGIKSHPDVRIVYTSESIGQRAMTNRLCRLSEAKYIIKCDAHCAFDEGFDVKLMDAMKDNWTMVPTMRNLHAFNWLCKNGHRRYQGPSGPCQECKAPTEREIVWYAKPSPQSNAYTFDKTMHFQYHKEFNKRPEGRGDITPSMSLQGSFFMLTRDKYWELNICDEAHGSWGQQGVEVALKTWLSGGEVMVNQKTWYAHMFRTQGGDFGFPYPISGKQVDHARQYSRDLWLNNKWPLAIHDLQWVIDKFSPVPDWSNNTDGPSKGIIFYTDNQLSLKIAHKVQGQLKAISKEHNIPITSTSLKPMPKMGNNTVVDGQRGHMTMYKQILTALENCKAEIVYFCEHDVLYHPSHFNFTPPLKDKFYYNHNWWSIRLEDGFAAHWNANRVSQLVCYREHAIKYYKERIAEIEAKGFNRSYEPGGRDKTLYESFTSGFPNIDIRHKGTLTGDKWSLDDFKDKSTAEGFETSKFEDLDGWSVDLKDLR